MDQISPMAGALPHSPVPAAPAPAPALAVVSTRLRLALPTEGAPEAWEEGLARLLEWLGVGCEFTTPARPRRLPRVAEWAAPAAPAPLFAPWTGWAPSAFQHGGLAGLPQAQFAASYCIDHARGGAPGGIDVVLMSPHPALAAPEEPGTVPALRPPVLQAMIAAARAEGRERIAIILHARQRNAVARQLLAAGRELTREGVEIDILTIEDALPPLLAGARLWDAIIVMPDLRGTVFTLLAESSGVRGAWPMLWRSRGGLAAITAEAPGEGASRLPLDAPTLIHALALTLHEAGAARAAARLHEGWARLRDSGVTTAGRGTAAPYVKAVGDAEFLAMLCTGKAASQRPQQPWRALGAAKTAHPGSHIPVLRVVS